MPDGVFARTAAGALHFHSNCWLAALNVEEVLATVKPRIARLLERRARDPHHGDGSASNVWAEDAPVLTGLAAASAQAGEGGEEGRVLQDRPDLRQLLTHGAAARGGAV